MLENKKHVFWQAFLISILIFFLGFVFGVYLEQLRIDEINTVLYQSEVSLIDSLSQSILLQSKNISCIDLSDVTLRFADKIYEEARILEQFDDANKLTDSIKILHKKYDLLRTLLWMNTINIKSNCKDINTVVYLYIYDTDDIDLRAKQIVWSRILQDLKEQEGGNIVLVPIAVDNDITTLDYLLRSYNIDQFPSVMINERHIIYDLKKVEELKNYIN